VTYSEPGESDGLPGLPPLHEAAQAVKVRLAHRADAVAVNELLDQLGYPQGGEAATADRIQTWTEDPSSAVYVAEAGDGLLGVIAVHVCPFFERDGSWGRITALVVSDRARGRGIGTHLVAAAESFAATRGCLRMEVTSADRRQAAHEFYRRRGYVDQAGKSSRLLRDLPSTDDRPAPHIAGVSKTTYMPATRRSLD
jgi:GNAT superfamily N-acetyltransferase